MTFDYPSGLYEAVHQALVQLDSDVGVSECHGMLCGMLCGPGRFEATTWIQHVTARDDVTVFTNGHENHPLWTLLTKTLGNLDAEDLSLTLMLPHDDEPLADRAAALGAWCRGFLSGFGLTGPPDLTQLSEDNRGFLTDLRDIGRLDADGAAGETDERALFEVTEYVRVGAMLMREETRFVAGGVGGNETLH